MRTRRRRARPRAPRATRAVRRSRCPHGASRAPRAATDPGGAATVAASVCLSSRATASRSAGATSAAKCCIVVGSSLARMNVPTPSSMTYGSSCSTHCAAGPSRNPAPAPAEKRPPMFTRRRISRGIASGGERRLVDRAVARGEVARLQVGQRRQPAVALAPDEPQHPGLERADPDRDVVRGGGPALRAADVVVLAVDLEPCALALVPDPADDVDRLRERVDGLAGREAAAAHGVDRIPEAAGAESELEATAAEQVEAGGGPREDRGRTQRQVGDVGREVDALGARRDPRQQRRRVVESRLVRVVLERDEVVAEMPRPARRGARPPAAGRSSG